MKSERKRRGMIAVAVAIGVYLALLRYSSCPRAGDVVN